MISTNKITLFYSMFITLYIICLIVAYLVFFSKHDCTKYKKTIIRIHLASLAIWLIQLLLNFSSDYALYGAWTLPFVLTCYFVSGLFLFVYYGRSSNILMKIYGGVFFFYPILIIVGAIFSRFIMVIGIAITVFALDVPANIYSGKGVIIREGFTGVMAASQRIELYKSCFPLVKKLGETSLGSETLGALKIDSIVVTPGKADTIIIKSNPDNRTFKFHKTDQSASAEKDDTFRLGNF